MKKLFFALLFFTLSFMSCTESNEIACPVTYRVVAGDFELQSTWRLVGFVNRNEGRILYPPCETYLLAGNTVETYPLLLNFTQEAVGGRRSDSPMLTFRGNGPVNEFSGAYTIQANQITVGEDFDASELEAVGIVGEYEQRYFDALQNMNRYKITNNMLTIIFGEEGEELTFVRLF
jgi:hypothetical protein